MAVNLTSILLSGQVKKFTHFTKSISGDHRERAFTGTIDITSAGLTSTSKGCIIQNGVSASLSTNGTDVALKIASTTQVTYSTDIPGDHDFSFTIVEIY